MKKFWKYFLILILLLAGLFCVGLLYLFFVPNSSMFGITYISYSDRYQSKAFNKDAIHTIEMESRSYDVNIQTSSSDSISVIVDAKSFGYVLEKNSYVNLSTEVVAGILKINITEPSGLAFKNNSSITLRIPENYNVNLKLTNKNAETNLSGAKLTLNTLNYTTQNGDFYFNSGAISSALTLDINKAEFNLTQNVQTTAMDVNLKVSSGKFKAGNHPFKNVNVLNNTNGVVAIKSCETFTSISKSSGGKFSLGTVNSINVESSDTNIEINKLLGGTIKLTESGKVYIKNLESFATIQTNSGSITIENANAPVSMISESGDQKIINATKQITAESTYGNINVDFKESEGTYNKDDTYPSRSVIATTKNGKITLNGVDNIKVGIVENGTGRADIKMRKVLGDNTVDAQRGDVVITIANTEVYQLITESTEGGSVYVNVGQFAVNGYTTKELTFNIICPYEGEWVTAERLTVTTTSGSLKVVDELNS